MKKILLINITVLCIVFSGFVQAQEKEYDLSANPSLFHKAKFNEQSKITNTYKNIVIFIKDTTSLSLPFVDDFSSNKITSYDSAQYPASAKTKAVLYSFRVNGNLVDTITYVSDTAYSFTYNAVTNKLDSTAILPPTFVIDVYENLLNTSQITESINAWLPYYRPVYDTIVDTLLYQILVQLDTTRILEIDSITYVNTKFFPGTTLWYENEVFINNTYPINPPSIGVATFDGLDSTGYPYNFVNTVAYGLADKLSSKYIDLSQPLGTDSILFSFFYQAKGLGNTPEATDSLVLEFKDNTGNWNHMWASPGKPLVPGADFNKVNLYLRSGSPYLFNGFQFRFKNYATLSGNVDHWHIDYVRLKKITAPSDTVLNDIAFAYAPSSLLNEYQAVPYTQYDKLMMKTTLDNTIENLNTSPLNYGFYSYSVTDNTGAVVGTYTPTLTTNIAPSYPGVSFNFPTATNPPINFDFSDTLTSCRDFIFTHERSGTPDQIPENDKVSFVQHITNYFAYDDASAESAYGLVQAGGQVALKFTLSKTDVISGAYVYFNPVVDNATNKVFRLTIWNESGGEPGGIIYQTTTNFSPKYNHVIDGFYKLDLDTQLTLSPGNFFIGWVQSTANELNIGLDKRTDNGSKLYYNIGSGWNQSIIFGSLMLHPVFGACEKLYIGVERNNLNVNTSLQVYPNPASSLLQINTTEQYIATIEMYDLTGKLVSSIKQSTKLPIDISALDEGIYLLRVETKTGGNFTSTKVMVMR